MTQTCYKFLATGGIGPFSGFHWPRPSGGRCGPWVTAPGGVDACRSGLHACRPSDLPYWLHDELWSIELAEPILEGPNVLVAGRGRLLRQVATWHEWAAREFAENCSRRCRDLAVAALSAAGRPAAADRLARCVSLEDQGALGEAEAGSDEAARVAGYARDAAVHSRRSPATTAFIAARAARVAGPGDPVAAERAERARQARWLTERLGLDSPVGGLDSPVSTGSAGF